MSNKVEVVFSGVGGQGLIVSGALLGRAAIMYDNKNATLTSSYGVETRGTFTKSDVIVSDGEIFYPEVIKPNLVLALAQVAYDKYIDSLDESAILIYDSGLIQNTKASKCFQYGYSISEMARALGNVATSNIIALGIIINKTQIISQEAAEKSIMTHFKDKPHVIDMNIRALEMGIRL